METLKLLIIDDEQPVRELLANVVPAYCSNVELLGTADSVKTALAAIHRHKPDLLLLDINLPDGTGFDLMDQLEGTKPRVIFITAYNEYAVRAFKISAVDY